MVETIAPKTAANPRFAGYAGDAAAAVERLADVAQELTSLSVRALRREKRLRDMRSIVSVLPECDGNVSKIARMTEIPRSTVYILLREMNLLEEVED